MRHAQKTDSRTSFWLILVTGLGFFIDSYDVFSYNVMREPSLTELGLGGDALTRAGMTILNWQVFGTLLGGFAWGLLGDRVGRKRALLGSILVYSVAMLANAFVHDVASYAIVRFCVGFGIAGEVGLGATLVGEILPRGKRTFGLAFFTALGLLGVAAAALGAEFMHWRTLCLTGGAGGLLLLALRHLLMESPLFSTLPAQTSLFAPLKIIGTSRRMLLRYVACVFALAPNFFVTGVLLTLSPEIAKALNVAAPVKASLMLAGYFIVAAGGDLLGAGLSTLWRSRKRALLIFLCGNIAIGTVYLYASNQAAPFDFYLTGAAFGLFNLWALAATITVEQFPTATRATVSTSALNFARAMVIPFNMGLLALKPSLDLLPALAVIGGIVFTVGLVCAVRMRETYHADLAANIPVSAD